MSSLCTVLDLVISTYFNHVNGAKCLIHINLCAESDLFPFLFSCIYKKNSTRLQWYSCARYKAPGPLVYRSEIYLRNSVPTNKFPTDTYM